MAGSKKPHETEEPAREREADLERVDAYLGGDASAFEEVDSWIRKLLEGRYPVVRHEVEDLCQIVHERLLENLRSGRFHRRSSLRTYVTGITHHIAIDHIRRIHRDRALLEGWESEIGRGTAASPYECLAKMEERQLLHQALLQSSPSCRSLWRMIFLERLSYAEIGRRLSIPPGTVKSRMWHCRVRALALLERLRRVGVARARRRPS